MEKVSMLAFHPVKMQSCYEKMEQLSLEGLQQRFDVSSPSVFIQRAQILMREVDLCLYLFNLLALLSHLLYWLPCCFAVNIFTPLFTAYSLDATGIYLLLRLDVRLIKKTE